MSIIRQRSRDFQSRFEIGEQDAIGNRGYDKSVIVLTGESSSDSISRPLVMICN